MATECTLAEYPPPFSGSTTSALAKVQEMPPGSNSHYFVIVGPQYPPQIDANEMAFLASIIPDGAMFLVKFGFGGEWHTFRRQGAQYPYVRPPTIGVLPPGFSNARAQGVLFQIRRMPERVGSPIELNRGIAVDLTYSGVGRTGQQFGAAQNSITILFNPGSDVEGIYIDNNAPLAATGTIYLLLGKIEKVGEVPPIDPVWVDKTIANISDSDALWVSIGARTGIPMTNDNMTNENVNPTGLSQYISATRTSATDRQRADAP
jgi:hypothetical protein